MGVGSGEGVTVAVGSFVFVAVGLGVGVVVAVVANIVEGWGLTWTMVQPVIQITKHNTNDCHLNNRLNICFI